MRQVHAVLRLKWDPGLRDRKIAHSRGMSRPTVAEYIRRAQAAGLSWPVPATDDEGTLERLRFPGVSASAPALPLVPDWSTVHRARKRKGVTLFLLGQAYQAATPDGLPYRWFCHPYSAWAQQLDLGLRQPPRAGEKLFVDYAGPGLPVGHGDSGQVHDVAMFVAVLGASNSTSAEATWSQSLPDWSGSQVRTFPACGGVPEIVVPDNLKAAVIRAQR